MKDDKIEVLKAKIANARFFLGMHEHAQKGMHPHPGHKEEVETLQIKIAKLEAKLRELESDE